MKKHIRGFTLIELMIVVAIVGILASLAYPSYKDSILKGKRAEARAALADLMQQQERYMTQRNTYFTFGNNGGVTNPANAKDIFKVFSGNTLANSAYMLSAGTCDAPNNLPRDCVKVIATPPAGSDPAAGDNIWMTSLGQKGCAVNATKPTVCWK